MREMPYWIIDDFYDNPHAVRRKVLDGNFHKVSANYPGLTSSVTDPSCEAFKRIARAMAMPLQFTQSSGQFRVCWHNDSGYGGVHTDKYPFSAVIYLSPPEHCSGGTAFYHHRETGVTGFSHDEIFKAKSAGWTTEMLLERIRLDCTKANIEMYFKQISVAEMRFNRCVIFPGHLLHAATNYFGDNWENGRMTQNFFFSVKPKVNV